MAWFCPAKYEKKLPDVNAAMMNLKGDLEDHVAKVTLAQFLRCNLGLATELLCGIQLAPYQLITLKAFFNRNFSLCVWGRGCSKSFIASIFCILQCIFEPNTHIIIAGPTFRTARNIFNKIDELVKGKGAELLAQAFNADLCARRNDIFEWQVNGGTIKAIPLNGEKIRGFRANILILDEFLLLSEDIINNVLKPFLTVPLNLGERLRIKQIEDDLIAQNAMTEKERFVFENNSKMICLSSASFTFEYLYTVYKLWREKIYMSQEDEEKFLSEDEKLARSTYFISQLSYEAIPKEMLDPTIIQEAKSGGSSAASFQREYGAQFTDGSDSYFSAKKMKELTIKDMHKPTMRIVGEKGKKYILSIDPSWSAAQTSDNFAMAVLEINEQAKTAGLVHCYAVAGGELRNHIQYAYYLLNYFNIVYIIVDNADGNFIQSCNESALFKQNRLNLDLIDFDSALEGVEYDMELKRVRNLYNLQAKKICVKQPFNSETIQKGAENLQKFINNNKLWFASKLTAHDQALEEAKEVDLPKSLLCSDPNNPPPDFLVDFISQQDILVEQTKSEAALIELSVSAIGHQTFDLPQFLKRIKGPKRKRKDSYTALMLGVWGAKTYFDIMDSPIDNTDYGIMPQFIA